MCTASYSILGKVAPSRHATAALPLGAVTITPTSVCAVRASKKSLMPSLPSPVP